MLRRILSPNAALALVTAVTACSSSTTTPGTGTTLDATATSQQVAAVNGPIQSQNTQAFGALSSQFTYAYAGSDVLALVEAASPTAAGDGALRSVDAAKRLFGRPSVAAASIPSTAKGKTFEWNTTQLKYVAGTRTGAPAAGVRFILYAVDLLTRRPSLPLQEIGYADITESSTLTSHTVNVTAVAGATTFLQFSVTGALTTGGLSGTVSGFTTDGTDRVDFSSNSTVSVSGQTATVTLASQLTVPTRGATYSLSVVGTGPVDGAATSATVSLQLTGNGTTVTLNGRVASTGSSITIKVNNADFATITVTAGQTTITGAGGQPLTAAQQQALADLFALLDKFGTFVTNLYTAIGTVL